MSTIMKIKPLKVILINPPITDIENPELVKTVTEWKSIEYLPYGLLSICSYVKKYAAHDVDFKIIDLNNEMCKFSCNNIDLKAKVFDLLKSSLQDFPADIVGISIMFSISYTYLDEICKHVNKLNPGAMIIAGGNFATGLYHEIVTKHIIDAVCFGEGEIPFCQLVDSNNMLNHIQENPSFITKEGLKARKIPFNNIINDLDLLPEINFDFIKISDYEKPITRKYINDGENYENEPVTLSAYSSRGCPFNCCFCACHVVHGKKTRFMSIKRFVDEVKGMIKRYKINGLFINDDNFLLDKKRAKSILNELTKLNIRVYFLAILVRNIDEDIAFLLKKLGTNNQLLAIESGSDFVLRNIIDKPLRKSEMRNAVECLRKFNIGVHTNVVIGFPGETDEHRRETLQTLFQVGFDWVHFLIVIPVPGSRLYSECKEKSYLVNECFYSPGLSFNKCNIRTPEYTPEHIEKQAYMMNLHANFVYNYNLANGNYDKCITQFRNIAKMVPNHAFAYYGLMTAHEGKGEKLAAVENKDKFQRIINNDSFWREWAEYFNLTCRMNY